MGAAGTTTQRVTLEMDTASASMSEPMQGIAALHEEMYPVAVKVVRFQSQDTMDTSIMSRFAAGDPPQAFEAGPGENAIQFANGGLDLSGADWVSSFSPTVLQPLTQNGKLIGVPFGVVRQNVAYWNLRVLSTLAPPLNAVPTGVDGFKTWLVGLSAAGYTHPLCFGLNDGWVAAHILFEDIVPAMAGGAFSTLYWSGKDPNGASSASMSAALDFAAQYVLPYLTSDSATMGMADGIDRVMKSEADKTQQCIMTAMGDWGGTQLVSAPDSYVAGPGNDFDASGWPGAEDLAVFADNDAMIAAVGNQSASDVLALFETLASVRGQLLFATKTGEMPARFLTPADQATLPYLVQVDVSALSKSGVPGFKVTANSKYDFDTLYTVAQNFFLSGDKTPVLAFLAQSYASLQ